MRTENIGIFLIKTRRKIISMVPKMITTQKILLAMKTLTISMKLTYSTTKTPLDLIHFSNSKINLDLEIISLEEKEEWHIRLKNR